MYITVKEAAKKWEISDRRVRKLCLEGKIADAYQEGKTWKIPFNAPKPTDGRYKIKESLISIIEHKLEILKKKNTFNARWIRKTKRRIFNGIHL